MRIVPVVVLAALTLPSAGAAQQVIPQPAKVTSRPGEFTVTARTVIWTDRASATVGRQLEGYLEPATGFDLRVVSGGTPPARAIALRRDPTLKRLGDEGYLLDVKPTAQTFRLFYRRGFGLPAETLFA